MYKKIEKLIDTIIPLLRKRDIFILVSIYTILYLLHLKLINLVPSLETLSSIIITTLYIALIGFIYLARWYKTQMGESLYSALLSPDREGSLRQLIHRARKLQVDSDRNKSKGWNTVIDGDGVVLGRNAKKQIITSPSESEEHLLCIGGSGSGKTSSVLIPTALRFRGGIFAIDISGDIYKNTKHKRNIALLAPNSANSVAFNVFAEIDAERDRSKKIILLKKLANLIVPEKVPEKTGDGIFFQAGASAIYFASLIYFYNKKLDFCDICYELLNTSAKELMRLLKSKDSPPNARLAIADFADIKDVNLASMKQQMDAYISVFATSRPIKRILHRDDGSGQQVITAEELEKRDIFLCIPQSEIIFFSPLMRLISNLVLDYCANRPLYNERKILICLDEFSSLGFLDILNPLATLRKHSTRIMILTQSLADIDNIYGVIKRKVILDNCRIKIVLGAGDRDTQEFFAKLVGTRELLKQTRTYSDGQARHTYSTVERAIIAPEEFGYLRDDCVVLLPDGYMKLNKAYFFQNIFR